ncbi:unnamed protein product [Prunus armeniaca]
MRKEQGVVPESKALVLEYRGRTSSRKFHRRDKSKGRSRDDSRRRSKTRRDLECYHCGEISHMKRKCSDGFVNFSSQGTCRIVDYGASFDDVRHIPDMRLNLISTRLLEEEGYTNVFAKGKWKLSKNSLVLALGRKENTCKRLQILAKKRAPIRRKKGMPLKSCMHCLTGKQHKASFQHGPPQRKPNVLDVVYSDEVFKQFDASVEQETGRRLKCIQIDNGGEYLGAFGNYCRYNGIRHERSIPKTPQPNDIAERMNRTIVESIRTILSHDKLPKRFWGEALMTAVDLINSSPLAPLNDKRSKLDVKSKECIFVGYGNEEFDYNLWDPIARKIISSRDDVFFEDQDIEDIRRGDKSNNPREYPANLDPVPPSLERNDRGDDPSNDPIINEPDDDDMSDGYTTNGIIDDVANGGQEAQTHEELAIEFHPRR